MDYKIVQIENNNKDFVNICRVLEKDIVEENLSINGGTLNYTRLTYDSNPLLIAISGEEIIGFNSLVPMRDTYYVWQIAVKKKYQGRGIGTELMKKAIEFAKEKDCDVTANVMYYNIKSQRMFLGLGFDQVSGGNNGFYRYYQKAKKMGDNH